MKSSSIFNLAMNQLYHLLAQFSIDPCNRWQLLRKKRHKRFLMKKWRMKIKEHIRNQRHKCTFITTITIMQRIFWRHSRMKSLISSSRKTLSCLTFLKTPCQQSVGQIRENSKEEIRTGSLKRTIKQLQRSFTRQSILVRNENN